MARETVLIVEDEEDILELIMYNLSRDGYRVTGVTTGEDALESARTAPPDIILLDLMLPGVDGLEVCRILKNDPRAKDIPIIMLTAKGEEADMVVGLELGADDYITKPFSPRVLAARLKAVLRRKAQATGDDMELVRIHGITIHPGRHEAKLKDRRLDLTNTEFRILHILARKPGWVFTRGQIINEIHGDYYSVTDRAVDVHIATLRKKLGPAGKFIETVRGVGYKFKE